MNRFGGDNCIEIRQRTMGLVVCGRITTASVEFVAVAGFKTTLCSRPDGEGVDQLAVLCGCAPEVHSLQAVLEEVPEARGDVGRARSRQRVATVA